MTTLNNQSVELLNLRLQTIEDQLFGSDEFELSSTIGSSSLITPPNALALIRSLSEIDQKLKSLTIGKERFSMCYTELGKFEKWITSDDDKIASAVRDSSSISESESSKCEEILAFENEIQIDANMATKIGQLKPIFDSDSSKQLRSVPELEPKLENLKLNLLNAKRQIYDLEDETRLIIEQTMTWFNDIASKLSSIHEDITQLERKKEEARFEY